MLNANEKYLNTYHNNISKLNNGICKIIVDDGVDINYLEQACCLDQECYADYYQYTLEQCLSMFQVNNMIYSIAVEEKTNEVIGYINLSPLKKDSYDLIKSGKSPDSCLTSEDIIKFEDGIPIYLYFASIVVREDRRKQGVGNMLLKSIGYKLEYLKQCGFQIKSILFDDVSPHGLKLSKSLGLKYCKSTIRDSKIYERVINDDLDELIALLIKEI